MLAEGEAAFFGLFIVFLVLVLVGIAANAGVLPYV